LGLKRGEIWTVAGGPDYAGKPRPAVIVQNDAFDVTASVTICGITTNTAEASLCRITVEPSDENGLRSPCRIMADKITTVALSQLGVRVGSLEHEDLLRWNRALILFLNLVEA
jgi:mRNA interferase MazF